MVLLTLNTIFYLIHSFTENYDNEADFIAETVAEKVKEFHANPVKFPYIAQMQTKVTIYCLLAFFTNGNIYKYSFPVILTFLLLCSSLRVVEVKTQATT